MGFELLLNNDLSCMSLPLLAPKKFPCEALSNDHLVLGKYYMPLKDTPTASKIYGRLVNVPSHPDLENYHESI